MAKRDPFPLGPAIDAGVCCAGCLKRSKTADMFQTDLIPVLGGSSSAKGIAYDACIGIRSSRREMPDHSRQLVRRSARRTIRSMKPCRAEIQRSGTLAGDPVWVSPDDAWPPRIRYQFVGSAKMISLLANKTCQYPPLRRW